MFELDAIRQSRFNAGQLRVFYSAIGKVETSEYHAHNKTLIPSGEAQLVGWSRSMLYLGFMTLPRSIVRSAGFIRRWDNTDVMSLNPTLSAAFIQNATESDR